MIPQEKIDYLKAYCQHPVTVPNCIEAIIIHLYLLEFDNVLSLKWTDVDWVSGTILGKGASDTVHLLKRFRGAVYTAELKLRLKPNPNILVHFGGSFSDEQLKAFASHPPHSFSLQPFPQIVIDKIIEHAEGLWQEKEKQQLSGQIRKKRTLRQSIMGDEKLLAEKIRAARPKSSLPKNTFPTSKRVAVAPGNPIIQPFPESDKHIVPKDDSIKEFYEVCDRCGWCYPDWQMKTIRNRVERYHKVKTKRRHYCPTCYAMLTGKPLRSFTPIPGSVLA